MHMCTLHMQYLVSEILEYFACVVAEWKHHANKLKVAPQLHICTYKAQYYTLQKASLILYKIYIYIYIFKSIAFYYFLDIVPAITVERSSVLILIFTHVQILEALSINTIIFCPMLILYIWILLVIKHLNKI